MAQCPRIGAYSFGHIEVDGRTYSSDVVILPSGVRGNWWRNEGHMLKPGDLSDVLEASLTAKGETWVCAVRILSGTVASQPGSDFTVIVNSLPSAADSPLPFCSASASWR